jgi:hypothetical protein
MHCNLQTAFPDGNASLVQTNPAAQVLTPLLASIEHG